jgi:integrase
MLLEVVRIQYGSLLNLLYFTELENTKTFGALFGALFGAAFSSLKLAKRTKDPVLNDRGGDVSQIWYIEFGAWDAVNKKIKRRKFTSGLNKLPTAQERYAYAEKIMAWMRRQLAVKPIDASPPRKKKETSPFKNFTLTDALAHVFERKEADLSRNWKRTHQYIMGLVSAFYGKKKPPLLSTMRVMDYLAIMDWMHKKKRFGPKTYNEYLGIISSTVAHMVLVDVVPVNYASRVPKKRVPKGESNIPFSMEAIGKLKAAAEKDGNPQWCLFIDFCLYTLARPRKELHFLQVKEIREKSIFIPKERGKTGGRTVPILPPLEKLIKKHQLRQYPEEYYVFGKGGSPGPNPYTSTHFYDYLQKYLAACKIDKNRHTLYAFKHTGAIMAYKAGVPVSIIQVLIGHESASQTEEYLINMGLINKTDQFLGNWPEY